jgi:hypothetical protein
MSLLTDTFDAAQSFMPKVDMAAGPEVTVNPEMLMDVNAVGMSLQANPHIPMDQNVSYQMQAPGVDPSYQMKPPEGSDMQVRHLNENLDHTMKLNGGMA